MITPYFSPSLHVPDAGRYVAIAAALAMLPSAWLYAWVTAPAPSILNPLSTLGLGLWLALVATCVAMLGKIRNPHWMGRAGAALGVLTWYVQWAAWIAMSDRLAPNLQAGVSAAAATAYLCMRPDLMLGVAAGIVGSASSTLTGAAIVVVWVAELCACLLPPRIAGARRAGAPFCEQTACWAKEVHVPVQFDFIHDSKAVRRLLEQDSRELLSVLVPCSDEAQQFADVTIHRCHGNESYVTICNMAALAPEEVPIPEIGRLSAAMPDKVACFGQVDEPVVELLRFQVEDMDALLREWEDAASGAVSINSRVGTT
jgi:hypothetical protein